MLRTRVGYAGGSTAQPTYRSIGDHAETIQVDYDTSVISYEELLDVLWSSHSPASRPYSRQYASIIFYHSEEQHRLSTQSKERQQDSRGAPIYTEIVPFDDFTLAEDYHQKYRLGQAPKVLAELRAIFPDRDDFVNATLVARANGYAAGYGTFDELQAQIEALGLDPDASQRLLDALSELRR